MNATSGRFAASRRSRQVVVLRVRAYPPSRIAPAAADNHRSTPLDRAISTATTTAAGNSGTAGASAMSGSGSSRRSLRNHHRSTANSAATPTAKTGSISHANSTKARPVPANASRFVMFEDGSRVEPVLAIRIAAIPVARRALRAATTSTGTSRTAVAWSVRAAVTAAINTATSANRRVGD
jgi:hypothetical protein